VTGYSCSTGTLSGQSCISDSTYAASPASYSCDAGDTLSGSTCTHTTSSTSTSTYAATVTGYSCSSGDTLSGSTCTHTTTSTATTTYSCPSGYTLSGASCTTTITTDATKTLSCNGHGSLQSDGQTCTTTAVVTTNGDETELCQSAADAMGLLLLNITSGGNYKRFICVIGAVATYSCPSGGALNGSKCTANVTQAASTSYSCGTGTLSGSSCIASSTYAATVAGYSCTSGDALSGSTCTHSTTSTSSSTYAASAASYSCSSGDTLSGSTCTHRSTSAATPNYGCSSGTLSGSNCTGVVTTLKKAYIYLGGKQIAERDVTNNGIQYVHTDALGSPVAHTNASGVEINRTRFEPYGYTAGGTKPGPSVTGQATTGSAIGFTGHVNDPETDLVYMQQRYYDPIAGRFLSVDPVVTDANTGGMFGRYTYVDNNPYRYVDPDGRDKRNDQIEEQLRKQRDRVCGATGCEGDSRVSHPDNKNPVNGNTVIRSKDGSYLTINQAQNQAVVLSAVAGGLVVSGEYMVARGGYLVYVGVDYAGVVRYVGITSQALAARVAQHMAAIGTGRELLAYRVVRGMEGLTKLEARIAEQARINLHGLQKNGGDLLNKINSIAEKYWVKYGIE
jgi:RHS repeat-associated protein